MKKKIMFLVFVILAILLYTRGYISKSRYEKVVKEVRDTSSEVNMPNSNSSITTSEKVGWNKIELNTGIYHFSIDVPASWKAEGLFDESYRQIYKDAFVKQHLSFPIISISDPQLGNHPIYKDMPFNALIMLAHKGNFAKDYSSKYENNQVADAKKVNYYPGYTAYEIKSEKLENPADWMDEKNSPPPLKTIVSRKIYIQISPELSYEISYYIEKDHKFDSLVRTYNEIISTLKFTDSQ